MKRIIIAAVLAVVLLVGFFAWHRTTISTAATASASSSTSAKQDAARPLPGAFTVHQESEADGYRMRAERLAALVYRGDPVAIEQSVELNGACVSASSIARGANVSVDMSRLQDFCRGYLPDKARQIDWDKSFSATLSTKLDRIRASQGAEAVADELGRLLADTKSPVEARDAIQYAAENDVIPSSLHELVAGRPVPKDQLETLAQMEFCRRGGDCGSSQFSTLVACAAIGPCHPGEDLVSLFQRKVAPADFEAAQRMSQVLAKS